MKKSFDLLILFVLVIARVRIDTLAAGLVLPQRHEDVRRLVGGWWPAASLELLADWLTDPVTLSLISVAFGLVVLYVVTDAAADVLAETVTYRLKLGLIYAIILVLVFFVTSSDSGSLVMDSITAGGKLDAHIGTARYLQSWWANEVYARLILNLKLQDVTSSFRCWQADALRRIDLDAISSNGYSFQIEMAYVAEKLGYKIVEVPIHYEERRVGRSKLNLGSKLEAAWRTWEILWRYRDFGEGAASSLPADASHNGHEPPGN